MLEKVVDFTTWWSSNLILFLCAALYRTICKPMAHAHKLFLFVWFLLAPVLPFRINRLKTSSGDLSFCSFPVPACSKRHSFLF